MKIASLKQDFAKQQIILSAVFSYLNVLNNEKKLRAVEEDINLAQQKAYRQDVLQSLHTAYFQLMRVNYFSAIGKTELFYLNRLVR
ncbi:MAG: hypothetical protein KKD05_07415 [Candidatus Omnitrophica bacterium]|nr:hypothetical protein [Candidatus Omnitrophota bacterium]